MRQCRPTAEARRRSARRRRHQEGRSPGNAGRGHGEKRGPTRGRRPPGTPSPSETRGSSLSCDHPRGNSLLPQATRRGVARRWAETSSMGSGRPCPPAGANCPLRGFAGSRSGATWSSLETSSMPGSSTTGSAGPTWRGGDSLWKATGSCGRAGRGTCTSSAPTMLMTRCRRRDPGSGHRLAAPVAAASRACLTVGAPPCEGDVASHHEGGAVPSMPSGAAAATWMGGFNARCAGIIKLSTI
mmetsp:Transcript_99842/g.282573  ORF Transcript_99842/g.282573 Transcript_99842/m.282573 type:complete len:242 (+) Transcript_99842:954-1679(+)